MVRIAIRVTRSESGASFPHTVLKRPKNLTLPFFFSSSHWLMCCKPHSLYLKYFLLLGIPSHTVLNRPGTLTLSFFSFSSHELTFCKSHSSYLKHSLPLSITSARHLVIPLTAPSTYLLQSYECSKHCPILSLHLPHQKICCTENLTKDLPPCFHSWCSLTFFLTSRSHPHCLKHCKSVSLILILYFLSPL